MLLPALPAKYLAGAFVTMHANRLKPDAFQALMRHKSYQATQVSINMARHLDRAVAGLHVPEVLREDRQAIGDGQEACGPNP